MRSCGMPAAVSPVSSTLAALVVMSLPGQDPTTGHEQAVQLLIPAGHGQTPLIVAGGW